MARSLTEPPGPRNPAHRRVHPHRHRDSLADHAPACLVPAAERCRCGAARAWSAGAHPVYSRLDQRSRPATHDRTGTQQRRGAHSLARAVFVHRLGEIRDRTYENQQHRASGLNFIVTAIILWNTRYLERAVAALRLMEDVPDHLLAHLSPLGWEHVNLTGDYVWVADQSASETDDGFKPLRTPPTPFAKAA